MRAEHRRAARRHLQLRGFPRQRRHHRRAADDRARPDHRRRPHDARFLALLAALRRPAQHRPLHRGRLLLRRAQARLPRRAGECRLPRADRLRHPRHDLLGVRAPKPVGGYTETILRVIDVGVRRARARPRPSAPTAAPFGTINALSLAGHRDDGRALGDVLASSAAASAATPRATASTTATSRSRPRPSRRWRSSRPPIR